MNMFNGLLGLLEPGVTLPRRLKRRPTARGPAPRRRPFRPGVEALEERQLLSNWVVTNTADSGVGSLRQAIIHADTMGSAGDHIVFDIPTTDLGYNPTTGAFTIRPQSALPLVSTPVSIDGYTQPGAAVNTATAFDNAQLKIVLDGIKLSSSENGLLIPAGGTTVRGLVIENFPGYGVYLGNAGNDTVAGDFIGTDVSGKAAGGNAGGGVYAINAGFNTIGGPALGDRNIISSNGLTTGGSGIFLSSDGNSVQNNYVGADASAMADLGNYAGIDVQGSNNLIGGGSPGEANLIAGNGRDGVSIEGVSSAFNKVYGNQITSNGGGGVGIYAGAHDNFIGNSVPGAPVNDISNNQGGVYIDSSTANFVSGGNSFSANGGAIQLFNNDNNNQAAPVLTLPVFAGGPTTITGTLQSTPNTTFELNFWDNPPSNPAEGKVFLGSIAVTTDPGGKASFTAQFNAALSIRDTVTATAAGPSGTSQFSAPLTVVGLIKSIWWPPGPQPTVPVQDVTALLSVQRGKLRHNGSRYRQTITLHNAGAPLQGLLYLVVDLLTPKVRLRQPAGRTMHAAPLSSPYVLVSLANNMLGTGETRTVVLTFVNPLRRKIHYNLRVLDGSGQP
jgi:hypothetical protein